MKGGKRPGAGRPKIPHMNIRVNAGYRLQRWLLSLLRKKSREEYRSGSAIIEEALIEKYGFTPPETNNDDT